MGMYDSIVIDHLTCPYCKKKIKDVEFQTKEGKRVLASFHMGDVFPLTCNIIPKSRETWISGLASCPNCHTFNRKTKESLYTWLEGSFLINNKTHRIIQFEIWRFMRDIPKVKRQRKYFKLRKRFVFNPSKRK